MIGMVVEETVVREDRSRVMFLFLFRVGCPAGTGGC
jgi:hypothetical protein